MISLNSLADRCKKKKAWQLEESDLLVFVKDPWSGFCFFTERSAQTSHTITFTLKANYSITSDKLSNCIHMIVKINGRDEIACMREEGERKENHAANINFTVIHKDTIAYIKDVVYWDMDFYVLDCLERDDQA